MIKKRGEKTTYLSTSCILTASPWEDVLDDLTKLRCGGFSAREGQIRSLLGK